MDVFRMERRRELIEDVEAVEVWDDFQVKIKKTIVVTLKKCTPWFYV